MTQIYSFCGLQVHVRELFSNCSRTSRTNLQLFSSFANNSSRTRTRDEHHSFFTNSRRTHPKSRSRRNFLFVFVFVVREPYLRTAPEFTNGFQVLDQDWQNELRFLSSGPSLAEVLLSSVPHLAERALVGLGSLSSFSSGNVAHKSTILYEFNLFCTLQKY